MTQDRRKKRMFFCETLLVYLGHGIVHDVQLSFFSKPVFGRGVKHIKLRKL